MNHLTQDQLIAYLVDGQALTAGNQTHLAQCADCRAKADDLRVLARELSVARLSTVAPEQRARYLALFDQIQRTQSSTLPELWHRLVATLAWDSRQQPAFSGVRGGATAYRLLFTSPMAEVELLVEPAATHRIEGELMSADGAGMAPPALIQMVDQAGVVQFETTSDVHGRFHLASVTPATYGLLITPAQGPELAIDDLDLS